MVIAVLLLNPAPGSRALAQVKPWWGDIIKPGPFAVGFTTQILFDEARLNAESKPRRVQLGVWYPSTRMGTKPLSYGEYLRIAAAETTLVQARVRGEADVKAYRDFLVSRSVPEKAAPEFIDAPLYARRDAPSDRGPYSLLVMAQGNGQSAGDQAVLGEYLASYGYWVLTSPSQARITGKPSSEREVGIAAEDQLADMWMLRAEVREKTVLRRGEGIVVIGHSFGARSALLFGMSDPLTVKGIVSLDGGIGTATAREAFEAAHTFVEASPLPPLLHIYEDLDVQMTPDWGTLRKLSAAKDIWIAKTRDLHHQHFTTLGAASAKFPELGKATGASEGTGPQYAAVLDLTRAFVEATLRGDSTNLKRIQADPASLRMERLP